MVTLCAIWGFQQVAIKAAVDIVPPILQAGIRSAIASVLVVVWMALRGRAMLARDGTLGAGLLAGLLFAAEFLCVFVGLEHTTASRMAVFLYTAPCFTALGLHWSVPGERLRPLQWAGMGLSFAGIALAFADGLTAPASGAVTWVGDVLGILAGAFWGITTVVVRASRLADARPSKTLLYQLVVSAIALLAMAVFTGNGHWPRITPLAAASLAYQGIMVAFVSYMMWFWLLTRYIATRLAVFTFLTPLFGVTFGVVLMHDPIGSRFLAASALVLVGIGMVNARR